MNENLEITIIIGLVLSLVLLIGIGVAGINNESINNKVLDNVCQKYFGTGYVFTPMVLDGGKISCKKENNIKIIEKETK